MKKPAQRRATRKNDMDKIPEKNDSVKHTAKPYLQQYLHINLEALFKICRINTPLLRKKKIKIDLIDCCIFTFIKKLCDCQHPKVVAHRKNAMTWLNISHLIQALPFLNLQYKATQRRIAKLAKAQLIKKMTIQETGNKRKVYVKIPDYYKQLEAEIERDHAEYAFKRLVNGGN